MDTGSLSTSKEMGPGGLDTDCEPERGMSAQLGLPSVLLIYACYTPTLSLVRNTYAIVQSTPGTRTNSESVACNSVDVFAPATPYVSTAPPKMRS